MKLTQVMIFALALLASCSKSNEADITTTTPKVDVVIGAASVATTRTEIGEDVNENGTLKTTVKWCVGDQAAVWAKGVTNGATPLNGDMFRLNYYGTNYSTAEFSSAIDPMDERQQYEYCAFYPCPDEGLPSKTVNYTIPSNQNGQYDGTLDFRVAGAVVGNALSGTIIGNPELQFKSLTHALKISIPEGTGLSNITKMYVITSASVVGNVELDMENISYTPTIDGVKHKTKFTYDGGSLESDNCNLITLDLSNNPISSGNGNAWLFINPTAEMKAISFIAFSGDTKVGTYTTKLNDNKTFRAGEITPVYFGTKIDSAIPTTMLTLKMEANNLGENPNTIKITAPAGATFANGSSSTNAIKPTGDDKAISVECDLLTYQYDILGKTISATYDSNNATVTGDIELIAENLDTGGVYQYTVPYLFFEDFSNVKYLSYHDNSPVGEYEGDAGFDKNKALKDYNLNGWTATRVGIGANTALRICCRLEGGFWVNEFYYGRVDSAPFSAIKAGKSVNVKVSYDYKLGQNSQYTNEVISWENNTSGKIKRFHESTTQSGIIDVDQSIKTGWVTWTTYINFSSYNSPKETTSAGFGFNSAPSYSGGYKTDSSLVINGAKSTTRISWGVDATSDRYFGVNGSYWLYIDNVKVSIK